MFTEKECAYTEYAVEVIDDNYRFVRQIDVFNSCEAAEDFVNNYKGELCDDEYLRITFIDYDKNDNEVMRGDCI